jgi:hypothetical protein
MNKPSLYVLQVCFPEGMNGFPSPGTGSNPWKTMFLSPSVMDVAVTRLKYYRKNWGSSRKYRLKRA